MRYFYVFPNDNRLKVNIDGDVLNLTFQEQIVYINMSVLRDGSATMVLFNPMQKLLYTLYNFREMLTIFNMSPTEFMVAFNQVPLLRLDKCGDNFYGKFFGDVESDTTDFSMYRHITISGEYPLDWQYTWICRETSAELDEEKLKVKLTLNRSDFWTRDIYASHGGQVAKLVEGNNEVQFTYVPGEMIYLGEPNCRYTARALDITRLLNEK